MTTSHELYLARVAEARLAADEAVLDNVRARCLRAAAAWQAMADRAGRLEQHRAEEAHRRALREDAAALILSAASFVRRGH